MPTGYIKKCRDHKGNIYSSEKKRALAYGMTPTTVKRRLDKGWTLQDALETPPNPARVREQNQSGVYDHLGIWYKSVIAMCDAYDIPYRLFGNRIRQLNWPLEKALTTPVKKRLHHIGEKYYTKIGLWAEIVDVQKTTKRHHGTFVRYKIKFEDGLCSDNNLYDRIRLGYAKHPYLKLREKSDYAGFDAEYFTTVGKKAYYKCECRKCGYKNNLTPQQMMEHAKEHD